MSVPEDYPKIIYKYRGWSNYIQKAPLIKGELYLSSPSDFNDPFDCRIPANFIDLSDTEAKEYAEAVVERHKEHLLAEGYNLTNERDFIYNRVTNEREDMQASHEKQTFESFDKHMGILSLSARWDSILMWSHYGEQHHGYCIGFNEEKMRNSRLFGSGGPVQYPEDKKYPEIKPIDETKPNTMFISAFNKSHEWNYEEEYRLTKLSYPNPFEQKDRVITVPNEFIEEVNLGLRISETNRNEIIKLCQKRSIPVYQLNKVPFHFLLDRTQIA
jgi:hypothetical protein